AWRFVAGFGLAGELGAGITLVSEVMRRESRGWGTMVVVTFGLLGAVAAALVGDLLPWRHAYIVGGCLGLVLLLSRIGVAESFMFEAVAGAGDGVRRGDLVHLLRDPRRALRYASVIATAIPIWYVIGILVTFSPEFGRAAGMSVVPVP